MDTVPEVGTDMSTHRLQNGIFRHIAGGGPEDVIQDHGEVHDVTHHTSNILLAAARETKQLVGVISMRSLTCLDIY